MATYTEHQQRELDQAFDRIDSARTSRRIVTLQEIFELCEKNAKAEESIVAAMKWRSLGWDICHLTDMAYLQAENDRLRAALKELKP